jgi:hypothetical protein
MLKSLRIQNLRVAFYMWLFNFLIGTSLFFLLYQFIGAYTGGSFIANRSGFQEYLEFLIDIIQINDSSLTVLLTFAFMVFLLFSVTSIFISAGIYSVFVNDEKATLKTLFSFSFINFFKILKIFVINLVNFTLVIFSSVILFNLFHYIQIRITQPTIKYIVFSILILAALFILIFALAIYDFSRILKLKSDKNIIFCFQKSIAFVWSKKFHLLILIFTFLMLTGILHVMLSTILNQFDGRFPIFIIFIIYHVFFFLKFCLKAFLMNAEVNFFDEPVNDE